MLLLQLLAVYLYLLIMLLYNLRAILKGLTIKVHIKEYKMSIESKIKTDALYCIHNSLIFF